MVTVLLDHIACTNNIVSVRILIFDAGSILVKNFMLMLLAAHYAQDCAGIHDAS